MKNPATHKQGRDDFNAFTMWIFEMIKEGRTPIVRLRDGRLIDVEWYDAEGPDYAGFRHRRPESNIHFCWNNDGTSITSRDFDMMETL